MNSYLKRTLICAVFAAFSIVQLRATDRIVGASSLFPTIGEALLASGDGDRILVEPGPYPEELTISKSITILPNQEGTRPTLDGAIKITNADGKRIVIMGIRCTGFMNQSGTYTTRTEVKLIDSRIDRAITLIDPYIHLELLRDTISCQATFSCGTVIGNEVPGCQAAGEGVAGIIVQGASALPDELLVLGNSIGANAPGLGVSITSDSRFHVENNYVRGHPSALPAVFLQRYNAQPIPAYCTVLNNTFYRASGASSSAVSPGLPNVLVRNNALVGYGISNVLFNPLVSVLDINTATGAPSIGSPLINAGDPDPRYLDLDLSVNDVGCYGGSNSRANFTTAMGSAVVGFMQAPRVVAQGQPVEINAVGFDR